MPLAMRAEPVSSGRGFAAWRVLVWLLLLLAAFGCVQYISHAQLLWAQWHVFPSNGVMTAALRHLLAWDIAYLLAAFALIVLCAGCILRQAWARPAMRVAAVLLALWALLTAAALLAQWSSFDHASHDALSQLGGDGKLQQALLHARNSYLIALVLKVLAIPLMLWLTWQLGRPSVRMQFRRRRMR